MEIHKTKSFVIAFSVVYQDFKESKRIQKNVIKKVNGKKIVATVVTA